MIPKSTLIVLVLASALVCAFAADRVALLVYFDNSKCKGFVEMAIPVYEGSNTLCTLQGETACHASLAGQTHAYQDNAFCGNTTLAKDGSKGVLEVLNAAGQSNNKVAFGFCQKSNRYPGCYVKYVSSGSSVLASFAIILVAATFAILL